MVNLWFKIVFNFTNYFIYLVDAIDVNKWCWWKALLHPKTFLFIFLILVWGFAKCVSNLTFFLQFLDYKIIINTFWQGSLGKWYQKYGSIIEDDKIYICALCVHNSIWKRNILSLNSMYNNFKQNWLCRN
jgi:hypothetical protein